MNRLNFYWGEIVLGGALTLNFTEILESSPSQRIVYWEAHAKAVRGQLLLPECNIFRCPENCINYTVSNLG